MDIKAWNLGSNFKAVIWLKKFRLPYRTFLPFSVIFVTFRTPHFSDGCGGKKTDVKKNEKKKEKESLVSSLLKHQHHTNSTTTRGDEVNTEELRFSPWSSVFFIHCRQEVKVKQNQTQAFILKFPQHLRSPVLHRLDTLSTTQPVWTGGHFFTFVTWKTIMGGTYLRTWF